jgi:hypothetical protein
MMMKMMMMMMIIIIIILLLLHKRTHCKRINKLYFVSVAVTRRK